MKKVKVFTAMQAEYINNRAAGLKQKDAAVAAGFSPTTAARQASLMETRADFKTAIAAAKRKLKSLGVKLPKPGAGDDEDIPERNKMPKETYTDSKEFLMDLMNHPKLALALRGDYAKALLPYQHGRVGETGKKQSKKERAEEITNEGKGGAKPKFAIKAAPGGNVVNLRG